MLGDQFNAATDGLKNRKRCSEAGAGPYCIKDSEVNPNPNPDPKPNPNPSPNP